MGENNGRVITTACDTVLKTVGTERYGDRHLTLPQQYLGVAQFGRAGSLGLSGRRFDPCHLDNVFVAQLVLEHSAFNGGATSSNLVGDTKNFHLFFQFLVF